MRPEDSMKRTLLTLNLLILIGAAGCTNTQLRKSTLDQGSTLAETQYQMILRNLASFAANPSAIPWHLSIVSGTAQVADSGNAHSNFLPQFSPFRGNNWFEWGTGVTGSRTIVEQWSTNPIVHTDALKLIQMAYRRALGFNDMPDKDLLDDMAHDLKEQIASTDDLRVETALFYQSQYAKLQHSYASLRRGTDTTVGEQEIMAAAGEPEVDIDRKSPLAREVAREVNDILDDLKAIPTGWFGIGTWHDVPKDACFVAHEGKVYVWVTRDHRDDLSKFTMAVLSIASAIPEPQAGAAQISGLNFSPGYSSPQ
jgi:hypothetical protein